MKEYLPIDIKLRTSPSTHKTEIRFGFAAGKWDAAHFFGKKPGEISLERAENGVSVILVSLGRKEDFSIHTVRDAAGLLGKWIVANEAAGAVIKFDQSPFAAEPGALTCLVEGLESGAYRFSTYKTGKEDKKVRPFIEIEVETDANRHQELLGRILEIMSAVNLARDWANEPANVINPVTLRERVVNLFQGSAVSVKIVDEKELAGMGAGGILAVGKGSATPPCFIVLSYPGTGAGAKEKPVVVVGKTITFDTGGYSLKDSTNILHMKLDKCGGMDVVGLMLAADRIKLARPLVGIITAAENMISAQAYRPDDIIHTLAGKTIEITSTDAEGRLILADALTYAQKEFKPKALIDLATLTGGVLIALGRVRAGLMGNDDKLAQALFDSGEMVHERLWRLPLDGDFAELIEGDHADLKNTGGREGSSILGGMFLKEFIHDDVSWAHIDIAGTADTPKDTPLSGKGATGFGIRLLLDFLSKG